MARISSPAARHIGAIIRKERRARKITIDELAAMTRIDSSNIRSYEAGRGMVNVHSLVRISVALGVEPGSLLAGIKLSMFERDA